MIQGFPKEYADKVKGVIDNRHLLMQAGNAMTVGVICALGEALQRYISQVDGLKDNRAVAQLNIVTNVSAVNNTLVGVVKNIEQYGYCIEKNIYYTYEAAVQGNAEDIEYVCMYQPKSAFGQEKAGIYLYGKVKKLYRVKRSQIHFEVDEKKKDRNCLVFQVNEWILLENSIKPSSNTKVVTITSLDKVKKAISYRDIY